MSRTQFHTITKRNINVAVEPGRDMEWAGNKVGVLWKPIGMIEDVVLSPGYLACGVSHDATARAMTGTVANLRAMDQSLYHLRRSLY